MKFSEYEINVTSVLQALARLDVACKYESNEFSRELFLRSNSRAARWVAREIGWEASD